MKYVVYALIAWFIAATLYTVDVSEQAIILEFGKPVRIVSEAGLHMRIPFIQTVQRITGRVLLLESFEEEFLTSDKKNITVTSYALWKVVDPLKFYTSVFDIDGAESRLSDVIYSQVGAELGRTPFSDIVSVSDSLQADKMTSLTSDIRESCSRLCREVFGIEIMDFGFSRFNFPDQNKDSVFNRMRAERGRIAAMYRSEGDEEAMKIKARADRERARILAEAGKEASIIIGKAKAEAAETRAKAFNSDPDFYLFTRKLQSYERFIDRNTTLILPGDSPLLDLLTSGGKGIIDGK